MPGTPNEGRPDFEARVSMRRRRRRLYNLTTCLFILFFLIFLGATIGVGIQIYQDWHDAKLYAGLTQLVTEPPETEPLMTDPDDVPQETELPGETEPVSPTEPGILPKYAVVYQMNEDMFGWLSIDGTSFNYPVMHTPEDEEYYLRRGFDRKSSRSGVPFMDADCETGCGNYLIYGHNMNNGTMFAPLISYQDQAFWKKHPVIGFDTLYEEGAYEVIAAFYSRVFYKYETDVFRYYEYHDLTDPEVFQEYVEQVKKLSIYDTGVDAEYGDQLITMITCSYGHKNERFVVVARKQQ